MTENEILSAADKRPSLTVGGFTQHQRTDEQRFHLCDPDLVGAAMNYLCAHRASIRHSDASVLASRATSVLGLGILAGHIVLAADLLRIYVERDSSCGALIRTDRS